jgi:hypothetical protein
VGWLRAGHEPFWTHRTANISTPTAFPKGRLGSQSTAYDATHDRLMVFGGFADPLNPCCGESQDTWVLSNATGSGGAPSWAKLALKAGSPVPPGRRGHSAVYDSATNRMIIFGGGQFNGTGFSPLFHDVWALKDANGLGATEPEWVQVSTTGGPPDGREGHGVAYNSTRREMIVFGGGNNGVMSVPNDLWVLSNANQDSGAVWLGPLLQTGDVPPPIEHFAVAYNAAGDSLAIAGGCCGYTNASRLLTNASGSSGTPHWMSLAPSGVLPPGGDQSDFGYDQASNRLIVEGPAPGGGTNATWLLTNAVGSVPAWVNSIPEGAPGSPPEDAIRTGSAYNAAQKKFILTLNRVISGVRVPEVWILSNADGVQQQSKIASCNLPFVLPSFGASFLKYPSGPGTFHFEAGVSLSAVEFRNLWRNDSNPAAQIGLYLTNAAHDAVIAASTSAPYDSFPTYAEATGSGASFRFEFPAPVPLGPGTEFVLVLAPSAACATGQDYATCVAVANALFLSGSQTGTADSGVCAGLTLSSLPQTVPSNADFFGF